jgi:hypothetical protein
MAMDNGFQNDRFELVPSLIVGAQVVYFLLDLGES